ncbi:MAG TPA: UDP-N-acetylmuramoyl-tripeptide--D-alanyl-D-alanine ligase [Thermomicrobiales bacterium]|nr:UDP-N-acetylmuramoyl-tripeptide--D-alanyl-D-alanine ligase [Thermomicrobiales bacterium]
MPAPIHLSEVLVATNARIIGKIAHDTTFRWIERNSREVQPGDLFLAVAGERFDGHQFLADATSHGAAAALVAERWLVEQNDPAPIPLLVVPDPVAALQQIASLRRGSLDVQVIGITGSIGKTSTKEVVAAIVARKDSTYRSPGNMNSEIGLPLSLLEIAPTDRFAVLEMGGAYAFGELALLAEIAKPTIGIVTNVHPVHLERMGTIENIALTKRELVEALPADGLAVLNGDDPRVLDMAAHATCEVITYGLSPTNDIWASAVQTHGLRGTSFQLNGSGQSVHLRLPLIGGHAPFLALPAIAVGQWLGMHISEIMPGFDDPAIQVRLLVLEGPNGSTMIDDTYNASAPSVLSALGLLEEMADDRRIAVLGDMRELGAESEEQHRLVGRRATEVVDILITYGPLAMTIAQEAKDRLSESGARTQEIRSFAVNEQSALIDYLREITTAEDTVLLKGSRGLEMENIVAALNPVANP